jgi:Glycosyltransferase sugar-binding region containing DXD motif
MRGLPMLRGLLSCAAATSLLSLSWSSLLNDALHLAPLSLLDAQRLQASLLAQQIEVGSPTALRRNPRITLDEITKKGPASCPPGLAYIHNNVTNEAQGTPPLARSRPTAIPRLIHQTSKSRCVTEAFANATSRWKFENWSYYFYDDDALMRLFRSERGTFPHIDMITSKCTVHGALRSDLFRYLALYRYGGIYADMDSVPNSFDPNKHLNDDVDGLFVVENYSLLSQYFIAISPRHPLMWYAVQLSLANLLRSHDTGRVAVAQDTGPHALHSAFMSFRKDAGVIVESSLSKATDIVSAGTFVGTHNRSITVIGEAKNSNEIVVRDIYNGNKHDVYGKMDMTHFQKDNKKASNRSCLSAIYDLYASETGLDG